MLHTFNYTLLEVAPYINWVYFFHAWGLSGKSQQEKDRLQAEAELMLKDMDQQFHTHAIVGLFDANADGDDIIIDGQRLPMLRQQKPSAPGQPNLCLADFIRPIEQGIPDRIGVFAATVDRSMEMLFADDAYHRMMVQTLADRLAEARRCMPRCDAHCGDMPPTNSLAYKKCWLSIFRASAPPWAIPQCPTPA